MTGDRIRVVIADDHAVVRAGLRAVMSVAKDIEIVGEARDGVEVLGAVDRLDPDVLVMDLSMGGGEKDGLAATRALAEKAARARILILTMHVEEEYLVPLLEAGAVGYMVKSAADRELVDAVRAVSHGDTYVQPSAARALARALKKKEEHADERARFEKLSDREQQVLKLVASGFSAPEIGDQLSISAKTVETYKQRIGEKLGLSHRADYVKFALQIGLLAV